MNNVCIAMLSLVLAFSASLSAQGTPQTKWNRTFEDPQASDTRPGGGNSVRGNKSVTTDAAGNVYVVGSTQTGGNQDILTAKYDAAGNAIWAASYGGPANADDFGYAIAVDSNGNVYAAGDSNNGSNLDFVLVKYDSSGNEQWVRTTNYGGTDTCYGVVVDSSDRVYIAGSGNSDAHIICYDTDGNVVWSDDYNNTTDLGYGLNVDASNNAYLVGRTVVAGNIDWFVAKYNASGVMQWDRTFNGNGNGFDEAYDVAVDATGNVLVAGVAADVNADAAVVKYDAAGTFQWAGYFNGSGNGAEACYSMGLDSAGNAYVATRAFGGATNVAAAVRFNAATGAVDWSDEYASAGLGDDAYSISVNAAGDNVIGGFTGTAANGNDFLIVKHDAGGTQAWARTFDGSANSTDNAYGVAIDVSGNVIVAGQSATATTPEGVIRSYDSTGATNWTGTLVGSAGTSQVGSDFIPATRGAMVTDSSGNVYVTGRSFNGTDYDAVTVAYDSTGTVLWTATYDGGNGDDYAHGVAVNENTGEVYVCGQSFNGGQFDMIVISYDSGGNQQWATPRSENGLDDIGYAVAVDSSDNVIVGGSSDGGGDTDFIVVRFDSGGNEDAVWLQDQSQGDAVYAMAIDSSDNVYITGVADDGGGDANLYAAFINAGFGTASQRNYDFAGGNDVGNAITVDASGNAYIAGTSDNGSNTDAVVIWLDPNDIDQWTTRINLGNNDGAYDIYLNGSTVYVAGFANNGTDNDFLLAALDADPSATGGTLLWSDSHDGPNNLDDIGYALAYDGSFIHVAGSSDNGDNTDYMVTRYDTSGNAYWDYIFNGGGGAAETAFAVSVMPGGDIAIAGTARGQLTLQAYRTVVIEVVNLPPTVTLNATDLPYTENDLLTQLAPTATLVDGDSLDHDTGTMTAAITANGTANDVLDLVTTAQIERQTNNVVFDPSGAATVVGTIPASGAGSGLNNNSLIITFNANAIPAIVQDVLQAIGYRNTSENPSAAVRTVQFTSTDGDGGTSNLPTMTITITPVNDAPSIGVAAGPVTFIENDPLTVLDAAATATDADSADFDTGTLTVSITNNGTTNDQLDLTTTTSIERQGNNVVQDPFGTPLVIGTIPGSGAGSGLNGADLTITFNALADAASTQQVMRQVAYQNTSEDPSGLLRTIQFTVTDGDGGTSNQPTLTVDVTPVNDAPTLTNIVTVFGGPEDQVVQLQGAAIFGAANEADVDNSPIQLRFPGATANVSVNGTPVTAATNFGINDIVTWTPTSNAYGILNAFSVVAWDGVLDSGTPINVPIYVLPVNDQPSFVGGNVTVNEDSGAQSNPGWALFNPGPNEAYQGVSLYTVNVTSGAALLSSGPAVDTNGTLSFTPAADANGVVAFDIFVRDNGGTGNGGTDTSATLSYTITINAVNDAPSFSASNPTAVNEDSGAQTISGWASGFSAGPSNESTQTLVSYNVSNVSNAALFSAQPGVNASGDLSFTPAANQFGTSTFDVTVTDNGGTANGGIDTSTVQTFTITVNPVNDAPTATGSNPVAVLEDAGLQIVTGWAGFVAGPSNESSQSALGWSVSNLTQTSGNLTFTTAPVVDTAGNLFYEPAPDTNGTATFQLTVQDNGGGSDTSALAGPFTITVTAVNDVPSFSAGPTVTVPWASGAQSIAGWATGISAGPTDESAQVLTFTVTNNSNAALFSAQPAVSGAGTLSFTPAANATGTATITLQLADNGGTANGGVDTSATQSFDIVIGSSPDIELLRGVSTITNGNTDSFGNAPIGTPLNLTYTIENVGNDTLTLTGTPPVALSSLLNCQAWVTHPPFATISAGGSTTFVLQVIPTTATTFSVDLGIANSDSNDDPYNLTLSGTGTDAPDIAVGRSFRPDIPCGAQDRLGVFLVGVATTQNYEIRNEGSIDLNFGATPVTISNETNCAVVATPPSAAIAAASNDTLALDITPTIDGEFRFTVSIATDDPDENPCIIHVVGTGSSSMQAELELYSNRVLSPGDVENIGFIPDTATTTLSYDIRNVGIADLTVATPISITNAINATATVVTTPSVSVTAGNSTTLDIDVTPIAAGWFQFTFELITNDADESPLMVTVTGTATATNAPEIEVARNGLSFASGGIDTIGLLDTAGFTPFVYTIRNIGTGTLNLQLPTKIMSESNCEVVILSQPAATLAPATSTTMILGVRAIAAGFVSAMLRVDSDDTDEDQYLLSLEGVGPSPDIQVESPEFTPLSNNASVYEGGRAAGLVHEIELTVRNLGSAPLNISGITISNEVNNVASVLGTYSTQVAPNGTTTVTIEHSPSAGGYFSFHVNIQSDDPDSPVFLIEVVGTTPDAVGGGSKESKCSTGETPGVSWLMLLGVLATIVLAFRTLKEQRRA